jgi:RNA polymerase sigma-70 factor (ECF subfamily)
MTSGSLTPEARAAIHQLMTRLGRGDRSAITPTFAALRPLLVAFATRALADEALGEDVAQQALLKVFEQAADFDPSRDGVAWALAIASYEVRTLRQRGRRRAEEPLGLAAERAMDLHSPEEETIARDLERAARAVLAGMGAEDARVILAAMGDLRPSGDATFRKRLQRALARLRHAWRARHGTP